MSFPNLSGAGLEAGGSIKGRAAITDTFTDLLSVDSSGYVQVGAGLTGVNLEGIAQLAGTALTATAAEINAVADRSTYAATATAAATPGTNLVATGVINFVTVTSADANHWVNLPDAAVGTIFVLYVTANGCELRTSAPATIAINGGAASNAESAIAANQMVVIIRTSATSWHGLEITGATLTAIEAAA